MKLLFYPCILTLPWRIKQTFLCFRLKTFLISCFTTDIWIHTTHFIIPKNPKQYKTSPSLLKSLSKTTPSLSLTPHKMRNITCTKATLLLWFSFARLTFASFVSNENYNNDFHITWSPNNVNTSTDGRSTSLKLDQESGN